MEENNVSVPAVAVKYGLIMGVISFAVGLATTYAFVSGSLSMLLFGAAAFGVSLLVMIVFMALAYREFKGGNGGFMSFGQGMGIGVLLSIVAAALGVILSTAYYQFVDTEIQQQVVERTISATTEMVEGMGGETPEGFEEDLRAQTEANNSLGKQLVSSLLFGAIGGGIIALIMSAIMKRTPDEE